MGPIGLTLLVALTALAAIVATFVWGANKTTDVLIGEKHRHLETITTTGDVPERWRRGYDRRVERMKARKATPDQLEEIRESARRSYLNRLGRLEKYAATSALVANEETRQLLLERLANAHALWEAKPARDL